MNNYRKVIDQFFREVEKGEHEKIIKFFAPKAIVHSPIYGSLEHSRFFQGMLADSTSMKIKIKKIFVDVDHPNTVAALIIFTWTTKNGEPLSFEGFDIFEFTPNNEKIQSLTFIYDTYSIRPFFQKLHAKK